MPALHRRQSCRNVGAGRLAAGHHAERQAVFHRQLFSAAAAAASVPVQRADGRRLPRDAGRHDVPVLGAVRGQGGGREAKALIVTACPLNYDGEYFSRELAQEQTLENLQAFSDKLAYCWQLMEEAKSTCWLDSPQDAALQEEADNGLTPSQQRFPVGLLLFVPRVSLSLPALHLKGKT